MSKQIRVKPVSQSRIHEVDFSKLPFGQTFSDHIFSAQYRDGAWKDFEIKPFGMMKMHPANMGLHYGQSIFEGMKATRLVDGTPVLFRPDLNLERLNKSAERMCMPTFPKDIFIEALERLIELDSEWIPTEDGAALYIRPIMFACDETIGVKISDNYTLLIMTGPVGPYFPKPVKLWVEEHYVRAAIGGVGEAKAAGNYGGSMYATREAAKNGYDQVIWLDATEHKWIQEAGVMNIIFVIDGKVITPLSDGAILKGTTRLTMLQLLRENGYTVEERHISIDEVVEAYHAGTLQEAFGAGTAAVVSHIVGIGFRDLQMTLSPVADRKVGNWLKQEITDIRRGYKPDTHGWLHPAVEAVLG